MSDYRFSRVFFSRFWFSRWIACAAPSLALIAPAPAPAAASGYVRVSQVGYEAANPPFQAYLMSTAAESGATFSVINSKGATVYASAIGGLLGTWSNKNVTYDEGIPQDLIRFIRATLNEELRCCHPRDIVNQVCWQARYEQKVAHMDHVTLQRAIQAYFPMIS